MALADGRFGHGASLLALLGSSKQEKRDDVYEAIARADSARGDYLQREVLDGSAGESGRAVRHGGRPD